MDTCEVWSGDALFANDITKPCVTFKRTRQVLTRRFIHPTGLLIGTRRIHLRMSLLKNNATSIS
ncbi:hypothetical protein DPMN_092542 [Dreissena polymorpha]|uniref:Uncharacterized protein n=1 Tax=Dreissena polymorpha TaxID=45954 RepID=A0A9D4L452_DREPO|nr:hypothetical protein DPMN_092542 [Dreissena polymorpha]